MRPRVRKVASGEPLTQTGAVRGLVWFLVLTVGGLAALFAFSGAGDPREVLERLSLPFFALAVAGALMDLLIGAVRYQIFLRRIRPGTSLWLPIRADLANRFMGAVTPSQTGGGPAQVFVLYRGGIPVPDALSFLLINFLSTLIFFLVAGGFAAWVFHARFPGGAIQLLVRYGFAAFATCLGVMLVGLFRPDLVARPLAELARRLRPSARPWARALTRVCDGAVQGAERYREACTRFILDAPLLPVASFLLTVILYLNKFTLAWLIMRGLGVEGSYLMTVAVQALLHFILYVAPSPGGSGIAELSTGAVMALLMPAHLLAPFTLAYRFFLLYLPATVGAFVMMAELKPSDRVRTRAAAPAAAAGLALLLAWPGPAVAQEVASPPSPSEVEALVVRGLLAHEKKEADAAYEEAVTAARALLAAASADAESHYVLAVALGYRLEHEGLRTKFRMAAEVRREAERALELDSTHAGAHHVLGRLHAGAMRLNPIARLVARKILGASVLEGASWERAEYHFAQAHRLEPENPRHAMELGALYMDTHRPELAREVLSEAVALPAQEADDSLAIVRARTLLAELPQD